MRRWRAALRAACILAVVAMFWAPVPAYAARTIALSSGSFAFDVDPGGVGEGEVTVINDGDEPLKALVYMTDVVVDETGEQSFVEPRRDGASLLTTPASWFRVFMPADSKSVGNTPYLELDPGERVPIRFAFSPPLGTPSGDHNVVLFFEMFELTQGAEGAAAQVSGRLGTRIALRVTGEVIENLTIRPFEVPSVRIGDTVPFRFIVNNGGNTNKRVEVSAALLDRSERTVVGSVVASDTPIYANARYQFQGALKTGAAQIGPHSVEVRVVYFLEGESRPTELVETRSVWLVPLWVVLLAGALVASVVVYGLRTAGRRLRSRGGATGGAPEPVPVTVDVPAGRDALEPVVDTPAPTPPVTTTPVSPTAPLTQPEGGRSARHARMTRKERKAEEEARRLRRAERAAEAGRLAEEYERRRAQREADDDL